MYLVIDIGATKTLIALFSRRGRVVRKVQFPTAQGMTTFFRTLEMNLAEFAKVAIRGLTIAIPGVVQKNYTVRFGNRNWGDVDILGCIKKLFNCQIYLENDANLAAIYEAYGLPGRTVYLTFSTGIGGGVIEDGKLVTGEFEPGHKVYEYKGVKAEWEDLAAASAIERIYHVDLATELRGRKVMKDVAARIYLGLPDIAAEFRPDTIVIGGPMGKIFRLFSRYLPKIAGVKYARPKRPRESVIYGGYLYALEHDAYVSEYPEEVLRGVPVAKVMIRRAVAAGRRVGKRMGPLAKKSARTERAGAITGIVKRVRKDFPELRFVAGRKFAWRPPRTVVIGPAEQNSSLLFLHELGHAVAGHRDYRLDVERLKMEAEAWSRARELAEKYGVGWDEDFAQGQLDSYRDWLHRRSRCPVCGLTRYQTPDGVYHCPRCEDFG